MLSQTGIVAVPSAADTWTVIGTETVPAGAKSIKKLRFSVAPDPGASATSIRIAPAFRIRGSGLGEQDPHSFLGKFGGYGTTTDGDVSLDNMSEDFDVDIPCNPNSTYTVEVNTLDEAITAGTVTYTVVYDTGDAKAKNSMADFVDAAVATAADAWSAVATLRVPQAVSGKEPTRIRRLKIGVAPDQGTSAVTLRTASRVRLTGSGVAESGNHEFSGPQGCMAQQGGTPVGTVKAANNTVTYDVDIPVKAGGDIVVEQRFDVEVLTAGTIAVGVEYA